jgi:hypothetical protein
MTVFAPKARFRRTPATIMTSFAPTPARTTGRPGASAADDLGLARR